MISEFGFKKEEILFDFSLDETLLLLEAHSDRMQKSMQKVEQGKEGSTADLQKFFGG